MRLKTLGLIAPTVWLCLASCKNEKAPQPKSDKTGSETNTSPYIGAQPGGSNANPDAGASLPTSTPSNTETNTSTNSNTDSGSATVYVDGTESSQIGFVNGKSAVNVTIKQRSGSKSYRVHLQSDSNSIRLSNNDSESVMVTYTTPNQDGAGTIKAIARDKEACESQSGSNCDGSISDSSTESYDQSLNIPWSTNAAAGGAGLANYSGTGSSGTDNTAMVFGFQLLSQILGFGSGPQTLFGTNQGQYGGGNYNAQQVGAWGQNQYTCTDPYGNYVDPSSYDCQNQTGNLNYGNQNYNGVDPYYNQNQYGNSSNCQIGYCSQCTASQCTSVGCRYTGGYCREPTGTGVCSRQSCTSCLNRITCQQQSCVWTESTQTCDIN